MFFASATDVLLLLAALAALGFVGLLVLLLIEARRQGTRTPDHSQEATFADLTGGSAGRDGAAPAVRPFGSLDADAEVDVSFVVPMYNEEERLPIMMEEALGYCKARNTRECGAGRGFTFEFILVDDGSKDRTIEQVGATREI